MQLNDYFCDPEVGGCGFVDFDVLCMRTERRVCPKCGHEMKIAIGAPAYHQSIEDWVESKRGHLHAKIAKSMQKDAARVKALKAQQMGLRRQEQRLGIKVEKASKGVSGDSFQHGGKKR